MDASQIMYLKKDNEADPDIQSNNSCLVFLKKFKKIKNDNDSKCISSYKENINYVSFMFLIIIINIFIL